MSTIRDLNKAIDAADWKLVAKIREELKKKTKPDNRKQNLRPKLKQQTKPISKKKQKEILVQSNQNLFEGQSKSNKVKGGRPEPIRIKKNLFIDNLNDHADELITKNPTLGTRGNHVLNKDKHSENTSKLIKVKCCRCQIEEYVKPILAVTYDEDPRLNTYKCNDCLTQR